jgi:hypothetical protein
MKMMVMVNMVFGYRERMADDPCPGFTHGTDQNLLDKLKVASSRDPSELSQSIESVTGSKHLLYQHYRVPTMVGPTLPA